MSDPDIRLAYKIATETCDKLSSLPVPISKMSLTELKIAKMVEIATEALGDIEVLLERFNAPAEPSAIDAALQSLAEKGSASDLAGHRPAGSS